MIFGEPLNIKLTIEVPFLIKTMPSANEQNKKEIQKPNSSTVIASFAKQVLPYDPFTFEQKMDPLSAVRTYQQYLLSNNLIRPSLMHLQLLHPASQKVQVSIGPSGLRFGNLRRRRSRKRKKNQPSISLS